jgi:hypothetical protein
MLAAALHARDSADPGDPRAYTTSASLWSLENPHASVDSSTPKVLAHHGWYIPVGLLALLPLLEYYVTKIFPDSNP